MREFSLDLAAENITDHKSREYFKEVLTSYYTENYRSAVVMLYSVMLTDMVLKLKNLRDIYHDTVATKILSDIDKLQQDRPTSPEWENELISAVNLKTNLFEPADFQNVLNLQKQRHLCAHPIISQNFELYRPNRETVRALMRNSLEGLLTKPAIVSRKIFDDLMLDIVQNKVGLSKDENLEKFLQSKYLKHLRDVTIKQIFKSIWKLTFRVDDTETNANRDILLRTLSLLLRLHYPILKEEISSEKSYYSKVNRIAICEIISVLNSYPELYGLLETDFHVVVSSEITSSADLSTYSWFLKKDLREHVNYLISSDFKPHDFKDSYISTSSILNVYKNAEMHYNKDFANKVLVHFFEVSNQYYIADERFDELIYPYLERFSEEDFQNIILAFKNNGQISGRKAAYYSKRDVKDAITKQYPDFDHSNF